MDKDYHDISLSSLFNDVDSSNTPVPDFDLPVSSSEQQTFPASSAVDTFSAQIRPVGSFDNGCSSIGNAPSINGVFARCPATYTSQSNTTSTEVTNCLRGTSSTYAGNFGFLNDKSSNRVSSSSSFLAQGSLENFSSFGVPKSSSMVLDTSSVSVAGGFFNGTEDSNYLHSNGHQTSGMSNGLSNGTNGDASFNTFPMADGCQSCTILKKKLANAKEWKKFVLDKLVNAE